MAVINQGGGIIITEDVTPGPFGGAFDALFAALLESLKLQQGLTDAALTGPSSAGAQVAGAFVDLSRAVKFPVTDTGAANTDFTITHNLGFTPTVYIKLSTSVAGDLYDGSSSPIADNDSITLRHTGANASIWVLLL